MDQLVGLQSTANRSTVRHSTWPRGYRHGRWEADPRSRGDSKFGGSTNRLDV